MGSTDEFQAWLASNPIDLDLDNLDHENIIKTEHSEKYLNDSTETEEETNVKTVSMINWMFEEDTIQNSVNPDIKEKKGVCKKRKKDVLVLICGWQFCSLTFNDWSQMHEHITVHHFGEVRSLLVGQEEVRSLPVGQEEVRSLLVGQEEVRSLLVGQEEVGCRWQGCGYGSQMVSGYRRHLNMHCYQVSGGRGLCFTLMLSLLPKFINNF